MKLWSMPSSGNSYKVRLALALLGRTAEVVDIESASPALEAARAAGQLPFGKAPVLEIEPGHLLPGSTAILLPLGEGTALVPADADARAMMLAWMFWEQNQHEGTVAVRAALRSYPERRHLATRARMVDLLERGHAALGVMEQRLGVHHWLVGTAPSMADVCLDAYTHTAGSRGGFEMVRSAGIARWLDRVAALPGHVGLHA